MRDRCIQFLFGLLIFSLVLTIGGFVASYAMGRKMAAFTADGHTVTGTVTGKRVTTLITDQNIWLYVHTGSEKQLFWLDVKFKTEDGQIHNGSTTVGETYYEGLLYGSPVQVTYVGSNPDWFYVGNDAPVDPYITTFSGMFAYSLVASLLFLIVLAAVAFWDSSDETPTVQPGTSARPGSGSFRSSKGHALRGLRPFERFSSRVPRQRMAALRTGRT